MLHTIIYFFAGAAAGSFFYTLAVRYNDGTMKASPWKALMTRSRCPHCGKTLNPLFLFPVLNWFFLKGRCHTCGAGIPFIYPASEIFCGGLVAAVLNLHGLTSDSVFACILCCIALTIAVVDFHVMEIPDSLTALFFLTSLYPVLTSPEPLNHLWGLVLTGLFFLVVILIYPGAFGGGDIKFAAAAGFYSGIGQSVVFLEAALITGVVWGLVYGAIKGKTLHTKFPFGPSLCAGFILSVLFGDRILMLYFSLID